MVSNSQTLTFFLCVCTRVCACVYGQFHIHLWGLPVDQSLINNAFNAAMPLASPAAVYEDSASLKEGEIVI